MLYILILSEERLCLNYFLFTGTKYPALTLKRRRELFWNTGLQSVVSWFQSGNRMTEGHAEGQSTESMEVREQRENGRAGDKSIDPSRSHHRGLTCKQAS